MKVLNSYEKRKEGQNDGTVYGNRDELCRLQFQSGKGGIKGRRRHLLFGKLTDEFHGRGRDGFSGGHHPGSGSGGVWGLKERSAGRGSESWRFWRCRSRWECGRAVKGPGDSGIEAETDLVTGIFSGSHVFFHGTYDVELAGSGVDGRQPYCHGSAADDPGSHRDGDQPEVFYQWF